MNKTIVDGQQAIMPEGLVIRPTKEADISRLHEIFAIARRFMTETGNPNQWAESYPSKEQLQNDISRKASFVVLCHERIIATFVLIGGNDPTYDIIYEGAWKNDLPYATIHRIASSGEVKGIFRTVVQYALKQYSTLRIDTHRDNQVMQHCILQAGFQYCGIIHCWNGAERLAYQLN